MHLVFENKWREIEVLRSELTVKLGIYKCASIECESEKGIGYLDKF